MRRELRKLVLLGLLFAVAVAAIAIPRIDFSVFGNRLERGNKDTFLGLTLGLDLQGGTHLVYRGINEGGDTPSVDDMEGARRIIEGRVNQFGLSEPTVQLIGTPPDRILVQLPGLKGEAITVRFTGDTVTVDQIKESLASAEIGRPDAEVTRNDDGSVTLQFDKLSPAQRDATGSVIKESEANRIQAAFRSRFPATVFVSYPTTPPAIPTPVPGATSTPAATSPPVASATSTPFRVPTLEDVQRIITGLGVTGASIAQTNPGTFTVQVPNFRADAVDSAGDVVLGHDSQIRDALFVEFGQPTIFSTIGDLQQFTVGGGVQEAKHLIGQTAQLEFLERTCSPLLPADTSQPW
ncbi:MAG: hypothetical protein HYY34_01895, partial [Chloroflexi bacterium]|nr:hypothetical protein [Chloroflexota bacterium]